jgi:hypothetical protein
MPRRVAAGDRREQLPRRALAVVERGRHPSVLRLSRTRKYLDVRSRPRRLRRSARPHKTRAGLEAKACGKLRPVGAARLDADTTAPAPPCHAKARAICGSFTARIHRVHRRMLACGQQVP